MTGRGRLGILLTRRTPGRTRAMNVWLQEAVKILDGLREHTGSTVELALMSLVGLVVFLIMMKITGRAVRNDNAEVTSNMAVLIIGAVLVMATVIALRLYVVPRVSNDTLAAWLLPAAIVAAVLGLVTPLLALIQRTGYFAALLMVSASLVLGGIEAARG